MFSWCKHLKLFLSCNSLTPALSGGYFTTYLISNFGKPKPTIRYIQDTHSAWLNTRNCFQVAVSSIWQEATETVLSGPGELPRYEPQRTKSYILTCAANEDLNQLAHPRSLIKPFFVRRKKLCIIGYVKCRVKILIRLRECAGWSESSLDAQVRTYNALHCGLYVLY